MDEELKRFGVSMEAGLLDRFDDYIREHAYTNRSEAIRDLVRRSLVAEEWAHDRQTVGAIVIVYNHHVPDLSQKINNLQHDFPGKVVAAMHVHLDHDNCMEVIVAEGKAHEIKKLSDHLTALRGVLHGTITGSASRSAFSIPHDHDHKHGGGHGHTHK